MTFSHSAPCLLSRSFGRAGDTVRPHNSAATRALADMKAMPPRRPRSLHFMPQDGTSGRTTSFHVSKIHSCKISRRSASSFKIVVNTKRYDFEADTPERAREIVDRILQVCESWRVEHNQPRMAFAQAAPLAGSASGMRSGKLRR